MSWLGSRSRQTLGTALAALLATAVVVAFAVEPGARYAYRDEPVYAAFEMAATLAALLAANLLGGRAIRTGARRDLLLACGFSILAVGNLVFSAIPGALSQETEFLLWAQASTAAAGGLLLAYALLGPGGKVRRRWFGRWTVPVACLGLHVVIALISVVCTTRLDAGVDVNLSPLKAPLLSGHPLMIGLQLAAVLGFSAAAIGGARLASRDGDSLLGWVAAGCAMAAGARATYAMMLPVSTSWMVSGDFLRLGFYLLLLVGGALEIRSYQRRLIVKAVADERRRIARDLHDGLAQDLSLIGMAASEVRSSAGAAGADAEMIALAARRAMAESRALLDALLGESAASGAGLERSVRQVAALHGVEARCDIQTQIHIAPETRRELERIAVEAVHNAARHGRARSVDVCLTQERGELLLRVADDGRGFDAATGPGRFGLTSMSERAHGVGGRLRISAKDGGGTTVEVVVP